MKLYASIDFFDEMCYAIWTQEMLDIYFRTMKAKGISRVYWLDQREIMMRSGCAPHSERMQKTWANFNGDLNRVAAELAHKNGLEIWALLKPYDLGIQQAAVSAPLRNTPGVEVTGGRMRLCTDFACQHQEVMLRRRHFPASDSKAVKYVITFSEALKAQGLFKVYTSENNQSYQLLSQRSVTPGTIAIEEPVPQTPFTVFCLEGCSGANTLRKIVTALDQQGNQVPLTLALCPGKRYFDTAFHLDVWKAREEDGGFRKQGMLFDYLPGVPSSIFTPETIENEYIFDFAEARENALGVTLQLNPTIGGCPDPENLFFHHFVTEWVDENLERGYDGIEIRISNHNSPLFWTDYGTGPALRLTRGNAHTALLRNLSAQVRGRGKKFGLHIANFMFGSSPDKSSPMEFFWDYHTWLKEKLADEVTAKLIRTDGFSAESMELLELCKAQNIPVNYCPFLHGLHEPDDFARKIAALGVDAFNIYEAATVWKSYEAGQFIEKAPVQAQKLWQIPQIP